MQNEEPHWASKKDPWGRPLGRYTFHGFRRGWSCHHCGGMFRSLRELQDHQKRAMEADRVNT